MLINIKSNSLHLQVDTKGAYVIEFRKKHENVFFPKTDILLNGATKARGGNHVCLPHFGPSDKVGQANHGYARDSEWKVLEQEDSRLLLSLQEDYEGYENMLALMEYSLEGDTFTTSLKVKNLGQEDFTVSPGFHPYFAFENEEDIRVDGQGVEFGQTLEDSLFFGRIEKVETGKHTVRFETENLSKYVVWSDSLDKYLCVEPTYNHKALDEGEEVVLVKAGCEANFLVRLIVE